MKNLLSLLICIVLLLTSCSSKTVQPDYSSNSTAITSTTEVVAVVRDKEVKHWYAAYVHHYDIKMTVYCEAFDLSATFNDHVSGMWIDSVLFDANIDDKVIVVVKTQTVNGNSKTWIDSIKRKI